MGKRISKQALRALDRKTLAEDNRRVYLSIEGPICDVARAAEIAEDAVLGNKDYAVFAVTQLADMVRDLKELYYGRPQEGRFLETT